MDIVRLLKEKRQEIQLNNVEFIRKIEPQFREISATINQTVINSLQSGLMSRFRFILPDDKPQPLPINPQVVEVYNRLMMFKGTETHIGDWLTIDQDRINQFAEVTGDHQWIHTDPERAKKESPFQSTVAHGFLLISLLPTLSELDAYGEQYYPEARMVVNCGVDKVRFLSPVKTGSAIRARTSLNDVLINRRSLDLINDVHIELQRNGKLVCTAQLNLRIYL
ncbi:MaoC family dehydratase [Marinibactrum halimedae]|uniref:MaoC-like domain-containing protein n=1 Tax=Marinibactrum halimedae TaxID=1444977 RepID=A0AA37WR75_9GAMM|nr:MaoC family dehydratase [Marinibactrum halimedae]MCD9459463.1 MaoC family dehydratase [Marinibactrum halimedae]GLS28117.1 hypothetical protein GCM10007877_38360 [Marinibactrum halimedae]